MTDWPRPRWRISSPSEIEKLSSSPRFGISTVFQNGIIVSLDIANDVLTVTLNFFPQFSGSTAELVTSYLFKMPESAKFGIVPYPMRSMTLPSVDYDDIRFR